MPPSKQPLKPPPLPPPKPTLKPLPPVPPPKPHSPTSLNTTDQPQHTNGVHGPPSPLRSPDSGEAAGEDGEDGELEVGSMVEVNDPPLFGVIRWIGRINGISAQVAGIELVRSKISSDSCDIVSDADSKTNKPTACVSGPGAVCRNRRQLPRRASLPLSAQQGAVRQASQLQAGLAVPRPRDARQSSGAMQLYR